MTSRPLQAIEQLEQTRFEKGRPMLLAGLRRQHEFLQAPSGIAGQWREFRSAGRLPGQIGSKVYGVLCGHSDNAFEYMCATEVGDFARLPPGTGRMRIAAERYAVFAHRGPPSALKTTWDGVFEWLSGNADYQSTQRPDFEVYDRGFDSLTDDGSVEIWVAIRVAVMRRVRGDHPASA